MPPGCGVGTGNVPCDGFGAGPGVALEEELLGLGDPRVRTDEASTSCCSSPRRAIRDPASSPAVADGCPAGESMTSTRNFPGTPPGPIATSMTAIHAHPLIPGLAGLIPTAGYPRRPLSWTP